ncbi:MAG TPA: UvrD-helicase domain-containing protein, partial [Candidatus Limnocylindrales bacterium]|nr:UvrD-helicase domain-containing protein [Candidatus Limnocylindrales bacterium]
MVATPELPRDPSLPPSVEERLGRLAPDQRAAATAPPGPLLCVAPAGSGKTTTLVARVAWLVAREAKAEEIAAITFNVRAAEELRTRLADALAPLGVEPAAVRVRTFHALGREILADASVDVSALVDRAAVLGALWPNAPADVRRRLDDVLSRLKLDRGLTLAEAEREVAAGRDDAGLRAFIAYERALLDRGALDFDDLVARAIAALEADRALLERWRRRCAHLLVDEVQDVDRSQLRLALLLAAPENRIFLVGDDDQTIYGWRLADVRRVLALDRFLPGLRRVDLVTNYRCPAPVVERAVRLVAVNRERFVKRIRARPGAGGRLVLAPDAADDHVRIRTVLATWPDDGSTSAVLARTNAELLPAVDAAIELGRPFRATRISLLTDDPRLDDLLDRAREVAPGLPLLVGLERVRAAVAGVERASDADEQEVSPADLAAALLAWAAPYPTVGDLADAIAERRRRIAELCRDDASLSLATIHGTKGLEFDHV